MHQAIHSTTVGRSYFSKQRIFWSLCVLCLYFPLSHKIGFAQVGEAAPGSTVTGSAATGSSRPDVVLIVVDDLGYGDLGCYGSSDLQTPEIDRLAAQGQKWSNFYANCPVCSPTRASILTGCYPHRVGVPGVIRTHWQNSWGKLADVPLLPEVFSMAGYQTSCIGKWHLGLDSQDHPVSRGFGHFHGFLGDMMDDYATHLRHGVNYMRLNRKSITPSGHATQLFADWAIESIESMAEREQPYMMYLAFNAPHTPIQPPQDALEAIGKRRPDLPIKRAKLAALIEDLDKQIGRVMRAIGKTQRETLTVFVSDNGGQISVGANNGETRDGKGTMYEGGLRIPAIFHQPGKIESGSTTSALGVTMDLLPTFCDLLDLPCPQDVDGRSLASWLQDARQPSQAREIFFVRREGGFKYSGLTIEAVRSGPWKLVHNFPTQPFELYNLDTDPLEENNLAQKQPQRLRQMLNLLQKHVSNGGTTPWKPDPHSPE